MSQKNFMSYGDAETIFTELGSKLIPQFVGTQAEWNLLSIAEKKKYKQAIFTDDHDDNPVGNLNALTTTDKSSVVGAINEVSEHLETEIITGSGTTDGYGMLSTSIDADRFIAARITLDAAYGNIMHYMFSLSSTGKVLFVVIDSNSLTYSPIVNTTVYYKILVRK